MGNYVVGSIGSGLEKFRGQNHLQGNNMPGPLVYIGNWEDSAAVGGFSTSGIAIPNNQFVNITPYFSGLQGRRAIALYNAGGGMILLGGNANITSGMAYPLAIGTEKSFSIGKSLQIWASASGTASEVRILEIA